MNPRLAAALGDRYAIDRELGAGGMALVYMACDLRHHRLVASKVLRPELAASLGPERFLREIEVAAGLQAEYDSRDAIGRLPCSSLTDLPTYPLTPPSPPEARQPSGLP